MWLKNSDTVRDVFDYAKKQKPLHAKCTKIKYKW